MVEPAFRVRLSTDPAITAVVGDRVYHGAKPQDVTAACIVLTRVGGGSIRQIDGVAGARRGRMQVDAFGPSYQVAKQLAELIRSRLDRFAGTVAGTKFDFILADDERDLPSAPLEGRAVPQFATSTDFKFLHQ